jgi:hypothetical protein
MSKRTNNGPTAGEKNSKRQKIDTTFLQVLKLLMDVNMLGNKDVINLQHVNKDSKEQIQTKIGKGSLIDIDKSFSCRTLTEFLKDFKKQYDPKNKSNNMKVKIKYVRCITNDSIEDLTNIIDEYSIITIENLDYACHGLQILLNMIESKKIVIKDLNIRNFDGDDLSNTWNEVCQCLKV